MSFSTEVASAARIGGNGVPLEHGKLGIITLNDEPVIWAVGNSSTDFTLKFLKRRHAIVPLFASFQWLREGVFSLTRFGHVLISRWNFRPIFYPRVSWKNLLAGPYNG